MSQPALPPAAGSSSKEGPALLPSSPGTAIAAAMSMGGGSRGSGGGLGGGGRQRAAVPQLPKGSVGTDPSTGLEDLDKFWEAGRSAQSAAADAAKGSGAAAASARPKADRKAERRAEKERAAEMRGAERQARARRAKEKALAAPKPDFRLADTPGGGGGGGGASGGESENSDPQSGRVISGRGNGGSGGGRAGLASWASRMAESTARGTQLHFSPGDLSRVSTLPPTPFPEEADGDAATPERARDADRDGDRDVDGATSSSGLLRRRPGGAATPDAFHIDADGLDDGEDDLFPAADMDDGMGGMDDDLGSPPPAEASAKELLVNTDDIEGAGFQLHDQDDEEEEVQARRAKKKKGRPDGAIATAEEREETSSAVTPEDVGKKEGKKKRKKKRKRVTYADRVATFSTPTGKSHGYPAGNRQYQPVPVSDFKDGEDDQDDESNPGGPRRSRRARFKPLSYWKNERLVYTAHSEEGSLADAMGDMPVVKEVLTALPTPYKERKAVARPKGRKKKGGDDASSYGDDESTLAAPRELPPFDSKKLRKKHDYIDEEKAIAWDEDEESTMEKKIVSFANNRAMAELPVPTGRGKKESKVVARASQAFNEPGGGRFPGWISGQLDLPPTGIKDAESVGLCSQVFNVASCQPQALEFALADPEEEGAQFLPASAQRFLLSPGDMFCVPAGNMYRIENHSKEHGCKLFWTIIRPAPSAAESL